eukprot:TRINITY_DN3520_c0_g1_i2.p1 TRINITY_DN3520_c0_g1~~TRINITY_DN3520_c0_g1_i2.p1  ORF type:complete len:382 (-),score=54.11 TRINITY_DN3520_c0_g1_i2:397-1428(-)
METLACNVRAWEEGNFRKVHELEKAQRNHGSVDQMLNIKDEGRAVAVKKMPNWWIRSGPQEFAKAHPKECERPWWDVAVVHELRARRYPHVCNPLEILRDEVHTYIVSELATEGDLFNWSCNGPEDICARDVACRTFVPQLVEAVRFLHDLGIAHRDLSLENMLITKASDHCLPQIKLIDFGMSSVGRYACQGEKHMGKTKYLAPELHESGKYDAFLTDAFAVGLSIYSMVTLDYPWRSTAPGVCKAFRLAEEMSLEKFLKQKRVRGQKLGNALSADLIMLMAGLLAVEPERRLCLGEDCMLEEHRESAWSNCWLAAAAKQKRVDSHTSLSTMAPNSDSEVDR